MTTPRQQGSNPRAQGTNPRAQATQDGTPPAASPGGGGQKARQEVSTQIAAPGPHERLGDAITNETWAADRENRELEVKLREKLARGMPEDELEERKVTLAKALFRQKVEYSAEQFEADAEYRARLERTVLANDAEALSRKQDADARVLLGSVAPTPPGARPDAEERRAEEERFMASAAAAQALAMHDDDCPVRKGKECSCRVLLRELESGALKELARNPVRWMENGVLRDAVLIQVDEGLEVVKMVADPISAQNPLIRVVEQLPARWVCNRCAMSIRGTSIDHRCDPADLKKAQSPLALARTLPADVKFGGAYRLFLWRDRGGDYHLGEMVVVAGRVIDERPIAGPESFNTIDAALLDAADRNLSP